jgi:hypothetical protein
VLFIYLKDQNGVSIDPISGEGHGNSTTYYFEGIDKGVTSLFVEPQIYTINNETGKLELKPSQVEPIEIRLDV